MPFETAIIERHRRREASVEEAVAEMYLAGVSVRRVDDIAEAPWGTRVSSGTVSRLNQKIYRHIEAWRNREIVCGFPYLYLDGVILKRSWTGEVRQHLGAGSDRHRHRWLSGDPSYCRRGKGGLGGLAHLPVPLGNSAECSESADGTTC